VGSSAPRLAARVQDQAGQFTHTCFMVTPHEGHGSVARSWLAEHTRVARQALRAVQLRRGGGGERGRSPGTPPGGSDRRLDHAYHGRTNLTMALTAKNMPPRSSPVRGEIYQVPMAYRCAGPSGLTVRQDALGT
jgi:4-aminobutyrate aminotransferase/(S)-3-amino-2-methylpropionate transaminase